MAVEQKRVSDMPLVPDGQLGSFDVFGWNKTTNQSGRAPMSKLKGDKGNSVELRKTSTHVQWCEVGTTTWNNLIPLADLVGETGASIEMQASSTHIQWRVQGSTTWINLISIEALRGNPGKSAYELWLQQPGNAGKTYSEYEAYNREPATAAKNEWNVLKPEITNKITEAGEAISNANTSASNADSKAVLANTAATNANTAASEANTAKEGVLDAIDNANDTAEHPTYIGTDFYVYKWNKTTKVYEKTDIFVKGSAGAGNVDIINSPTVKKDVPYVIVPTANAAQTYNAVEAAVGGRNLLRNYNSPDLFIASGGSILTKSVTEFSEFGITDANRVVSSGGSNIIKAYMEFSNQLPSGVKRIASIYLRNNSDKILTVHPNLLSAQSQVYVNPGEYTLLTLKYTGNGVDSSQIKFVSETISDNIDVTWARIMYEEGHIPSTPVPAPEDKLNVTDVINNLTSTDTNKPLSAAQGKLLQDNKASTTQLNSAISDFNTRFAGQYEIVSVLPAVGVEGKMYLVTTGTSNVYNLFTWKSVSGVFEWVDLGSTTVDLSQYAKSADVTSALSNKVDKVSGKGLSTNDYTNGEKSEVAKIANKADLGEDGKVLSSQLPAMSGGLGKPQEIKLLLSDAMPEDTYDGNYGFIWSLSTDGDSFVENCRFSLSCGDDAMPPLVWYIYVGDDGIAYLYVSFDRGPFTEYLILDRYTGFSNSVAPGSVPFLTPWSNTHIAQNTGRVEVSAGGMFTLTASDTLNVSFGNLSFIPLGESLRIRIKGNNSTNRTITIIPDGVTNELDNTSYQVNNVKTLELDIVNFGGEFIMKGVLYE